MCKTENKTGSGYKETDCVIGGLALVVCVTTISTEVRGWERNDYTVNST